MIVDVLRVVPHVVLEEHLVQVTVTRLIPVIQDDEMSRGSRSELMHVAAVNVGPERSVRTGEFDGAEEKAEVHVPRSVVVFESTNLGTFDDDRDVVGSVRDVEVQTVAEARFSLDDLEMLILDDQTAAVWRAIDGDFHMRACEDPSHSGEVFLCLLFFLWVEVIEIWRCSGPLCVEVRPLAGRRAGPQPHQNVALVLWQWLVLLGSSFVLCHEVLWTQHPDLNIEAANLRFVRGMPLFFVALAFVILRDLRWVTLIVVVPRRLLHLGLQRTDKARLRGLDPRKQCRLHAHGI